MWGAKVNQSRNLIEGTAKAIISAGQDEISFRDQRTLDDILWPAAKFDVVRNVFFEYYELIIKRLLFFRWRTIATTANSLI